MLTSKLLFIACTWGLALLVSISLRAVGIIHPDPFQINHLLVWVLVFLPSIFLLIYFLLKRGFSIDSALWFWGYCDFNVFTCLFHFYFQSWCSRFIDFWSKYRNLVDLCTYFFWIDFVCFCCGMAHRISSWNSIREIY